MNSYLLGFTQAVDQILLSFTAQHRVNQGDQHINFFTQENFESDRRLHSHKMNTNFLGI